MNRSLLTILLIFISLGCIVNESYGWDGVPIAIIKDYDPKYVLQYEILLFDGGNSHDHDSDEGSYIITDYDWIWPSSAYDIWESPDAGKTAEARFSPPGGYTVSLKVKDNENIWSLIEGCMVRVVEVTLSGGGDLPVGDLVEIDLSVNPNSFGGEMKLTALGAYKNSIKVWKEESKQTLYIGDGTYYKTWAPSALPATLWVEGVSPTGTSAQAKLTLLYDPSSHPYLQPVEEIYFTVYEVSAVTWESYMDNDDPDPHPSYPGNGGKRIFPGKKTYNDPNPERRNKVRVKATITPAIGNKHVYFSWWDVDDAYNDDPPIDTNGSTGNDNRGFGESLSTTSAVTDGSGNAGVTFTVSMQPGDNFKIAASCSESKLNELTQTMVDSGNLPDTVVLSPMLTVWRKLHVELDSMDEVETTGSEKNRVTGTADSYSYDPGTNKTTIDLGQDLASCWEETKPEHFENGEYKVSGNTYTPLETINHIGDDEIVVQNDCSADSKDYVLLDKDDQNILPSLPDTSKMNSIFDDCYIKCVNDAPGSTSTVAFKRNLGGATTESGEILNAAERGSASYEADDYWVVYVLSIFQFGYSHDKDPDSDPGQAGGTESGWQAAVIPLENIRDAAAYYGHNATTLEKQAVVHEVGHQVLEEGTHTANTIMSTALPVSSQYEKFSPTHIDAIRSQISSPGD